ncbi:bifunctional glycosyltransferase/CDP-glycerol:glycerophosphate glycerophosphotransferase [Bacillus tropicus]|uniref:bifunctional glycosyltransferase/CDP-glycerol:glycerophosphate glycerophosphotransferase n=1 Tax=Bacillus tropicus TaxID=2026188 RepID=UPI0024072B0B|nr:glycosyltransferase [Bacillus tropicus]MDF9556867.1 glycosyltransferase [Bacillus tropicus]
MEISHLGSCYYDKIYKFHRTHSKSSIISIMSEPLKMDAEGNIEKKSINSHMYNDLMKTFIQDIEILSEFSEYLIIDFMEERFDIAKIDGTYVTFSWDFKELASKYLNQEYTIIPRESEQLQEIWKEKCLLFIKELKKHFKPSQIVLHEAYKVSRYKKDGEFHDFPNQKSIAQTNEILKGYYEFFKKNYLGIHVISLDIDQNYCDSLHEWGCFPHHFHDEYYKKFLEEVNKLNDSKKDKYDVSIVITTYNNENDIEECIESALNQKNQEIEIIVVDDGSTDHTQRIVKSYADRLDNVEYVFLDNACNPSRNRNIGITMAKGRYITFLDGDDYLALDACEKMINYGEQENADIIVGRMLSFTINGTFETGINNVYNKDRNNFIQNIDQSLNSHVKNNSVIYKFKSAAAKLYKRSLIFNTFFDESLYYGEDFVFSQKAFLKSQKTIFIEDFVYYYRGNIEAETESLTQRKSLDKIDQACRAVEKVNNYLDYHRDEIKNPQIYMERIKKYRLQELVQKMNDFDYFLDIESQDHLITMLKKMKISYLRGATKEDIQVFYIYNYVTMYLLLQGRYKEVIYFRKILLDLKRYKNNYNAFKMRVKRGKLVLSFKADNTSVDVEIDSYLQNAKHINRLVDCSFENGELLLEGVSYFNHINIVDKEQIKHVLVLEHRNSKKKYYIQATMKENSRFDNAKHKYTVGGYTFKLDFKQIHDLGRYDMFLTTTCYGVSKTSKLTGYTRSFNLKCENKYFKLNSEHYELIISNKSSLAIRLNRLNKLKYVVKKIKTSFNLKKSTVGEIVKNRHISRYKKFKLITATLTENLSKLWFANREIWLVGEKTGETCNDNGYAFFKYCREKHPNKKVYYVIKKEAQDYDKVKSLGNVIHFYSLKHLYYSMNAKYIISTDNVNIMLPSNIRPLRKAKRIFIQHGVITFKKVEGVYHNKNDIADKFLVASNIEKEVISNHYGFHPKDIISTGLLRTQYLKNNVEEHNILLSFTWRTHIKSEEHFLQSNYYKRISSLINNEKLNQVLKDNGVKLNILLHPRMIEYVDLLSVDNSNIHFMKFNEVDVKNLIESSSMIVTDYSSILFDFIYLQKPVVMYGFDYFNGNQTLNYKQIENMLPNTFFLEENQVIDSIEQHCKKGFKISKVVQKQYRKMINTKPNSCEKLFNYLSDQNADKIIKRQGISHVNKNKNSRVV